MPAEEIRLSSIHPCIHLLPVLPHSTSSSWHGSNRRELRLDDLGSSSHRLVGTALGPGHATRFQLITWLWVVTAFEEFHCTL